MSGLNVGTLVPNPRPLPYSDKCRLNTLTAAATDAPNGNICLADMSEWSINEKAVILTCQWNGVTMRTKLHHVYLTRWLQSTHCIMFNLSGLLFQ